MFSHELDGGADGRGKGGSDERGKAAEGTVRELDRSWGQGQSIWICMQLHSRLLAGSIGAYWNSEV